MASRRPDNTVCGGGPQFERYLVGEWLQGQGLEIAGLKVISRPRQGTRWCALRETEL